VNWFGGSVAGTHEKKTLLQGGHQDIIEIVSQLRRTRGEEQWRVIEENFNVAEFVNYFAIKPARFRLDGFFNNYFTYHDINGSKKWEIYPWDRDKTWASMIGSRGRLFTDMP